MLLIKLIDQTNSTLVSVRHFFNCSYSKLLEYMMQHQLFGLGAFHFDHMIIFNHENFPKTRVLCVFVFFVCFLYVTLYVNHVKLM